MSASQPRVNVAPMSSRGRFRIATGVSLGFHALLVALVGLLAARTPVRPDVLVPIELTLAERPEPALVLGGARGSDAPPKAETSPTIARRKTPSRPSSTGGDERRALAPPKLLTAKSGKAPGGKVGEGKEAAGAGGQSELPAGPTRGASIVGGPLPVYPKDAVDQNLEGKVSLSVSINKDGKVESVTVAGSSGHSVLDEAAIRAVRQGWIFEGALADGKPAPGKLTVTFEFSAGTVKRG